jgi:hypothetical protein
MAKFSKLKNQKILGRAREALADQPARKKKGKEQQK